MRNTKLPAELQPETPRWSPGPWSFREGFSGALLVRGIADKPICVLHRIENLGKRAEREHNAQLIAAAPDLYAALAKLLRSIEGNFTGWPATLGEVEARTAAVAALDKAIGRK